MFFSVIVPVYNVASYLRLCLESLVNQTCTDFEIIVVDDGSTDGSGMICDEYAERHSSLTVIHQENQGLSGARNTGLKEAKGEWISFVDGDDWADPDMLEILEGHILASGADMYQMGYEMTEEDGGHLNEALLIQKDSLFSFSDEKEKFRFYFNDFTKTVRVWGGAYRKSIILEHRLSFVDTEQVYAEDLLFNFQYMLYGQKIVYLHDQSYHYRKRQGSLTESTGFEKRLPRVGLLSEIFYHTVEKEHLSYFQKNYFHLYFKILNRFIQRDGKELNDAQLRQMLDSLSERQLQQSWMKQIRAHGYLFHKYAKNRVWYASFFGSEAYERRQKRREKILNWARERQVFWQIWFLYQNIRHILSDTTEFPPRFMCDLSQKVAYLSVPKAACTSITVSIMKREDIPDDYSAFRIRRPLTYERPPSGEKWFIFTFVRNPFARLVSCYESKFHTDKEKNSSAKERGYFDFDEYLHGYLKADRGFSYFINQIIKIPWRLDNPHFCSQYQRIVWKDGKPMADFIGKFENLEADYEPIRAKYGFSPLKIYNKSGHGDWRDYYTTDLAKKVYKKYKKDVQYFGYEDEYRDLLNYCKEKERKEKRNEERSF